MDEFETIQYACNNDGIANMTLNRPHKHNAMNEQMIIELAELANILREKPPRACILGANGNTFCAGGDLGWMKEQTSANRETKITEAGKLAAMLKDIDELPFPLIAKVEGNAFGGGLGLISVCDIALASPHLKFAFTETKLGLIPATISPFVMRKIGAANARRYFLTAETFDSLAALNTNLVSEVCEPDLLETRIKAITDSILRAKPGAVAKAKMLAKTIAQTSVHKEAAFTAALLADCWEGEEAQAAISDFLSR